MRIKAALLLISLVILVLALSTLLQRLVGPPVPFGGPGPSSSAIPAPGTCHARNGGALPDPVCSPGVSNPDVTPTNTATTICREGWTQTIRPPVSYTGPLKARLMAAYGYTDDPAGYELDHIESLEIAGHPTDPRNLFPQPYGGEYGARRKDRTENATKAAICSGRMPLAEGQRKIAADWIALERELRTAGLETFGLQFGPDTVVDADDEGEP